MTPLMRSRSREVYRLYREDDFLGAEEIAHPGSHVAPVASSPREGRGTHALPSPGHRLRRLAGMAMLAAVLGAVGWLVALSGARSSRGPAQRRLGRIPPASAHRVTVASGPSLAGRTVAGTYRRRSARRRRRSPRWDPRRRRSSRWDRRRVVSQPLGSSPRPLSSHAGPVTPRHAEFGFERGAGT